MPRPSSARLLLPGHSSVLRRYNPPSFIVDFKITMPDPIAVALQFEQAINSRNAAAIRALLAPDSVFIDSLGNQIAGADKIRAAWEGYFRMVPDYTISHSEVFANGDTVAMFGSAQGTFSKDGQLHKENYWQTPAAWRAIVTDGKIALWQVFADNEPIRAIMRKSS